MGVGAVTYPRRSAWFSMIVRSSAEGRAAVPLVAVGDDPSREPTRKDWNDLPPLTDSVESIERESEAKLSTRGGMVGSEFGWCVWCENMAVSLACSSFCAVANAGRILQKRSSTTRCKEKYNRLTK